MPRSTPPTPKEVAARYDQVAHGYDEAFAGVTRRRWAVIEAPLLGATRGARDVLVLGCGTGHLLRQIGATRAVGVDVSHEMLRRAHRQRLVIARADAHQLPFRSGSFDAVVAGNSVWRYLRYDAAFVECARVLRPGGRLGLQQYAARTWSLRGLLGPPERTAPLHLSSADELVPVARDAGFQVERIHLFRPIRFFPYAVAVPRWLPGHWWRHCIAVFRKR